MAQIKPMPVHIREYYKAMKEAYTQKKDDALKEREELISEIEVLQQDIESKHEDYLKYKINLSEYPEFINNEYEDGSFLKMCKGAYLNRENNYTLTAELHTLLKLAEKQYRIYELKVQVECPDAEAASTLLQKFPDGKIVGEQKRWIERSTNLKNDLRVQLKDIEDVINETFRIIHTSDISN